MNFLISPIFLFKVFASTLPFIILFDAKWIANFNYITIKIFKRSSMCFSNFIIAKVN